jgi:hypothetical protein
MAKERKLPPRISGKEPDAKAVSEGNNTPVKSLNINSTKPKQTSKPKPKPKQLKIPQWEQNPEAENAFERAMAAHSIEEEKIWLEKTVQLDPSNIDARYMLLDHEELDDRQYITRLRALVTMAEKQLGKEFLKEMSPNCWYAIEARPYMRARFQLADALRDNMQIALAIKEYKALLKLSSDDNLGVRYPLLASYLLSGQVREADSLMISYAGDLTHNCVFAYAYALVQWVIGDHYGFLLGLAAARKQNPFVEKFIIGQKQIPHVSAGSYAPGSLQEAEVFFELILTAFAGYPKAWEEVGNLVKAESRGSKR